MGIVIRQSILTSLISYVGIVVGYINVLYLFPKFLTLDQVGLLRTIQDTAMLFVPFALVGLGQSIIKFYPQFSASQREANSFISMIFLFSLFSLTAFLVVFLALEDFFLSYFEGNSQQILQFKNLILVLTFLLVLITLLEQLSRSLLEIAFPSLLREVIVRVLQAIVVLVYYYQLIDFPAFIAGSVWLYALILVALVVFLLRKSLFRLNFDFRSISTIKKREIVTFSVLSFIGTSSMMLIGKMDSVMISAMIGYSANAIYTTAFYMATVIEIPKRAITTTASPLIAKAFGSNDMKEISSIYTKTSINQFIIGALLLTGIYINLENVYALMPKGEYYSTGATVILIVGAGKLIDMVFGPSSEIIGLSKHYWFNLVVITLLAVLIVFTNYILIPQYGINGAAAGTLISLFAYNFSKFIFIWYRFRLQPFTRATLKVAAITAIVVLLNYVMPKFENIFVDMFVRSAAVTIAYGVMIISSNASEEVNKLWRLVLSYMGIVRH
jgi:O-antigen/teichoic acid export membrane protein